MVGETQSIAEKYNIRSKNAQYGRVSTGMSIIKNSIVGAAAHTHTPISILTGTPFLSHSKYLAPGRTFKRSSTLTLKGEKSGERGEERKREGGREK